MAIIRAVTCHSDVLPVFSNVFLSSPPFFNLLGALSRNISRILSARYSVSDTRHPSTNRSRSIMMYKPRPPYARVEFYTHTLRFIPEQRLAKQKTTSPIHIAMVSMKSDTELCSADSVYVVLATAHFRTPLDLTLLHEITWSGVSFLLKLQGYAEDLLRLR
ncbi:hypothetical protein BOTBODRAFT_52988 [Botryobasidium botryosum FD-172 SS1]|uniref:Uncharacterized protein n=1 Tax=Botryobasidium botryosum (strain FD-172 SS1) TaxID=930990 RepID=A0A067N225_BOTB1|nr:hypothetical protein BOTBODRAFT_52988 [Botryobasidium botryosum FD-172 SS1]